MNNQWKHGYGDENLQGNTLWHVKSTDTETGDPARLPAQVAGR
jgi:hypothetical protein